MRRALLFGFIGFGSLACAMANDVKNAVVKDFTKGANTFMLTEAGDYSFPTIHVDSTAIEIKSADWLWGEKYTTSDVLDQDMISNVKYENGRVSFTASGTKGNAVIAGFDGDGKIVWLWLVWQAGEQPGTMEYENGTVFSDRYLGAPDAQSPTTIGYQFGRIVPFYISTVTETNAMELAKRNTVINPKYDYEWKVVGGCVNSLAESLANPTTFYGYTDNNISWISEDIDELWNPIDGKTNYDPCPAGYKMPMSTDYSDFSWSNKDVELVANKRLEYTHNGKTAYYPVTGYRHYEDGKADFLNNVMLWCGNTGSLNKDRFPQRLSFSCNPNAAKFPFVLTANRTFALGMRCVVDEGGGEPGTGIGNLASVAESNDFVVKQVGSNIEMYFNDGLFNRVVLADMTGRIVAQQHVGTNDVDAAFGTSNLQKGFYIVMAIGGEKSSSKKIVIE